MHTFETRHAVAHSADEMFALVADVQSYPKFLPLCEALTLKKREMRDGKEVLIATMTVGYKLIRESFTTEVVLDRDARTIAAMSRIASRKEPPARLPLREEIARPSFRRERQR